MSSAGGARKLGATNIVGVLVMSNYVEIPAFVLVIGDNMHEGCNANNVGLRERVKWHSRSRGTGLA